MLYLQVKATDNDFGQYAVISYDIVGDDVNSIFTIDKNSGSIYAKDSLDREHISSYELIVKATDSGGKFGYCLVKIKIGDVNDNAPSFLLKDYKIIVKNDLNVNSLIAKVNINLTYVQCFNILVKFTSLKKELFIC